MLADFENFLEKKDLTFLTFFCRAFEPVEKLSNRTLIAITMRANPCKQTCLLPTRVVTSIKQFWYV